MGQIQLDPKFDNLKMATKYFSPFQFLTLLYFYMVFVNSPYGEYGTKEALNNFILHYIPYMLWQMGMLLMAIQQCWFISLKGRIPFTWVTKEYLWYYVQFLWLCSLFTPSSSGLSSSAVLFGTPPLNLETSSPSLSCTPGILPPSLSLPFSPGMRPRKVMRVSLPSTKSPTSKLVVYGFDLVRISSVSGVWILLKHF